MPVPRTTSARKRPQKPTGVAQYDALAESGLDRFLRAHSGRIITLLCLYAGLRILIFSAAFPLFNNVDEQAHLISIQSYARGQWPGKDLPKLDPDSAKFYALYGTAEYLVPSETFKIRPWTPFYQLSPQEVYPRVARTYMHWLNAANFEAQSTPLYYLLGAAWYRLGEALGMREWQLAYWIRFLNPAAYALLMWVSYRFVTNVYPDRMFLGLGVPALLAVFPQDVFFGINRDVLSAPMCAAALLLLMKALEKKNRKWLLAAASLVGLAFLVNVSNCVLYGVLAITLWFWVRGSPGTALTNAGTAVGAVFASVALPSIWMLRNYSVMGDLTGSRAKIEYLGWTMKPLHELFHHPLFSFHGLSYFLVGLVPTFWHGEYVWHMKPMRWPVADWFYIASSGVMIVVFSVRFVREWESSTATQRWAELQALFMVLGSVLFMAAISLPFDFHNCMYPSQANPFFLSGRIISGALLPFVLIFVSGMEFLLAPIRKWVSPAAVLACLMVFITITEFQIRRVVFSSPNNFFALTSWKKNH